MTPEGESTEPLLALDRARIDVGGAIGAPESARGGARRLALVGRFRPLFRLLARHATLASGSARVLGTDARSAVRDGIVGLALCDPPLPAEWTLVRYLFESARLAGARARDARRDAEAAIERFELRASAPRRLADLPPAVRRIALLAHATLRAPPVVCAETPLADLDPGSQVYVAAALERVAGAHRLVVSLATTAGAERAFVEQADWVIVSEGERIVSEGPPPQALARGTRYAATVTRSADPFREALAARGVTFAPSTVSPALLSLVTAEGAEPCRLLLELPQGVGPEDVVVMAHQAGSPLVELVLIP